MNVINDPSRNSLARSLGTGLGKSLERLAEHKYRQLHERHQINKAVNTGAYTPEVAAFIQSLPEKNRWEAYQALAQEPQVTPQQYAQAGIPEQMSGLQEFQQYQQPNNQGIASALQQQFGQSQQQMQPQAIPTRPQVEGRGMLHPDLSRQRQTVSPEKQIAPSKPESFAQRIKGSGAPQQARNQALIDKSNANWLKGQQKGYEVAQRSAEILDQMDQLLDTGKVSSGIAGKYAPVWLQNTETQLFDKLSNELAGLLAQQYGIPTGMKIKFAQSQKPNLEQNSRTQRELIKRLRKETERPLLMNELKDQLIAENGYQQPAGLESRVNQLYKQYRDNPQALQDREQSIGRSPEEGTEEIKAHGDESLLGFGVRNLVRGAARAGEAVAGGLGDIAAAGLGAANYLTGGATPTYSEVQQYLPISAPTSQQIKDTLGKITNGYTDPQSGAEQIMDDVIGTVAAIFGPGKAKALIGKGASQLASPGVAKAIQKGSAIALPFSGIVPFKRALAMGTLGEVGAKTAEIAGAGPVGQSLTKLGFMIAAGGKGTRKAIDDLMDAEYKAASKGFAGKTVDVSGLQDNLAKYADKIERRALPNKEIAKEVATRAYNAIEGNSMPVADLIELKQDLNKYYKLATRAGVEGEKHLPKEIRPIVGDILDMIKKPLEEASNLYPEAGKSFAIAEDLFRGTNTLSNASKFLKEHVDIGDTLTNKAIKGSLLFAPSYALGGLTGGIAALPAAFATKEAAVFIDLLRNSPQALNHYKNAMLAAAQENKQAVIKNLAALDKELTQYKKQK